MNRACRPIALVIAWLLAPAGAGVPEAPVANGIWISREEIASLPTSGSAWRYLKAEADRSVTSPDLSDEDDRDNVRVLAKALVHARTGVARYRNEVIASCMAIIGTESAGTTLALGRELIAYVIAADLVSLPDEQDEVFRAWLLQVGGKTLLDGRTLRSNHEERPNNWGTHAGASRVAVAAYLGDTAEIERCARVFKGWLGDRSSYTGFKYGSDLSWQADPRRCVGINPAGATREGQSIDGVLPDDQRRGGQFSWPPPKENYVWEGLQGALAQAVILHRAGYDVWNWEDQALLRAFRWLHQEADFPARGDDTWQPHVINYHYGTKFPAPRARPGKNVGWTDWTHTLRSPLPEPLAPAGVFLRGDCDGDGRSDVTDAVFQLTYNFFGGDRPPCRAACDSNGDGDTVGISDAIYLLSHHFLGDPAPVDPFPECGPGTGAIDRTLGCDTTPERCQ